MTELINQFRELNEDRASLGRQKLLLENGQDILHNPFGCKQGLSFGDKGAPGKVSEPGYCSNQCWWEYTDKSPLYAQLEDEVECADEELEVLGKRVLVLVRVQEMLDARNGTKGVEDGVVVKIRRGGQYI